MRKFTKLLLTAMLLVAGVGTVNAEKSYATLSSANWWAQASWNSTTNTMSWNGVWAPPSGNNGTWYFIETGWSGDITAYTTFHATLSNFSNNVDHIWLRIKQGDNNYADTKLIAGENNIDLVALAAANPGVNFANITDITLWGAREALKDKTIDGEHPASVVIEDAYLNKPDAPSIKTPILLTGGKFSECFVPGTYYIEMDGWQNFTVYENPTGIAFDENSTMVFDMPEQSNNEQVRVVFTYDDESTSEIWWCTGIGSSADDPVIQWNHKLDNSTFWLKKGLGTNFDSKKDLKITKVTVNNQNFPGGIYKINGGTICGETMTIKKQGQWYDPKVFGAYGGEFRATAGFTNIFQMKSFEVGDNQKIVIKFSEPVPSKGNWNINNNSGLTSLSGKTEYEFALDGTAINDFTIFNWDENPDPIKISEVYFYKTVIEASEIIEAPKGTTDLDNLSGTNTGWNVEYPKTLGQAAVLCGDGDGSNEASHVTITGKDYIHFYVTSVEGAGQQLRVWIWDGESGGEGSVKTLYAYPIADYKTATWTTPNNVSATGTYVVDVSGYNYLKGVKTNWGGDAITISQAYLSSGDPVDYIPSGKYTLVGGGVASVSLTAALADANATFYDATGVTGAGVDLTGAANPNALFKANAGVLANTQNVITSGTCANLVLTDNHPFKAPAAFTATAASYNRSFTADNMTTVCLPFALTSDEASALGTFYGLSSVDGTVITFSEVAAPAANTPYLVIPTRTTLSIGGKSIAATPAETKSSESNIEFIGTLAATEIPASEGSNNYYAFNNGVLVRIAENSATLPAFRAYIKATGDVGGVKAFTIQFDDATGVNSLFTMDDAASSKFNVQCSMIYNVAGQRMSKLQKGLNIVNGQKVMVK